MTGRFADLADAGRRLAVLLADDVDRERALLLAAIPNGVPVAIEIADALGLELAALPVARGEDGAVATVPPGLEGRVVIVVDDGVETGTVARAAAEALRGIPASLVLAVPVCPREAMADLGRRYDRIVAVDMPMARRSLAWHFDRFDTIDEATAWERLAARS